MENQKSVVLERLKESANVLVTVSTNPSVDQLSGAIGLTLLLNKLGKHATAVFSGDTPNTLEFLQPEKTLEKNTDSLRDFIIALDKAKADKLRYKVEDKLVKIFITPYRTSLDDEDLEFSHGDFNVDVVIALGVHEQQDLDQAIAAHGRILHDANVISVNVGDAGHLGTINWSESSSSLCEMLVGVGEELKSDVFDAQMATAFLTGIVAETDRFSNEKTSSNTMSVSAKLMAAGANQQLVATQLQEKHEEPHDGPNVDLGKRDDEESPPSDGSLQINHPHHDEEGDAQIHIDEHGTLRPNQVKETADIPEPPQEALADQPIETMTPEPEDKDAANGSVLPDKPKFVSEPPSYLSDTSDNPAMEDEGPTIDPFSLPPVDSPFVNHEPAAEEGVPTQEPEPVEDKPVSEPAPVQEPVPTAPPIPPVAMPSPEPTTPPETPLKDGQTLADLEEAVDSPHVEPDQETAKAVADMAAADLESARSAVSEAVAGTVSQGGLEPIEAEGATPVNLDLGHDEQGNTNAQTAGTETMPQADYFDVNKLDETTGLPADQAPVETEPAPDDMSGVGSAAPPPPVPPPMMPPDMLPPLNNGANDSNQTTV